MENGGDKGRPGAEPAPCELCRGLRKRLVDLSALMMAT